MSYFICFFVLALFFQNFLHPKAVSVEGLSISRLNFSDVHQRHKSMEDGKFVPIFGKIAKNYNLLKNHSNNFLKGFDTFQHLFIETSPERNFYHDRYLSYQEQCNWLSDLAFSKPSLVTAFSLGYTEHNNEICAVLINAEKARLPLVWLDGNMAAKTWISSASLLSFTNDLVYSTAAEPLRLRAHYRFIIVPNLNPDGYEYSRQFDRLWVKNRRKTSAHSACVGVNLNRNFDAGQYEYTDECSEDFGAEAFSERETNAVYNAFKVFSPISVSLTFQSYGQVWLLPYACSSLKPQDYNELKRVAIKATKNIRKKNGSKYEVGKASDVMNGIFTGTAFDWSKLKNYSKYSYGVLLRPENAGEGGFEIGARAIRETGKDILYGIESILESADLNPVEVIKVNSTDC